MDSGEEEPVDLLTADHKEITAIQFVLEFLQFVEGADDGHASWNGLCGHKAGEDDVLTTGERPADRRVGFASHEDGVTHGGRLEEFEILGQMPRDRAGIPYNPVLCHSHNRLDHLETKMTANSRAEAQGRRDGEKEGDSKACPKTLRLCASAGNIFGPRILNSDWGFDRGVRVVPFQSEVFVAEILQLGYRGIENHPWEWTRFACELEAGLLKVVHVEVEIAEGVDEFLRLQAAYLRDHHGEKGVRGDVEGDSQKKIRAALVELAAEFAVGDIELDESMAGSEGHLVDLSGIPGADDVAAAVRVLFQILDHARDLVDGTTFRRSPPSPLRAIDRAEITVRISPLIPDGDSMLLEVADVCVPFEEP